MFGATAQAKYLYFQRLWGYGLGNIRVVDLGRAEKMSPASSGCVSKLLVEWGKGDLDAREALMPLVYDELRRIARRHLWRQRPNHTLQSAALVNAAYLRLVHQESPKWENRAHFFGVAAQAMRHILVDYAR